MKTSGLVVTATLCLTFSAIYQPLTLADRFETGKRCFELVVFDSNDQFVNLRTTPNGEIIRPLPNGTRLGRPDGPAFIEEGWTEVQLGRLGENGDVLPTQSDDRRGYVFSELLHRAVYAVEDPEDNSVNFRETPNGRIIKALANGTEVAFLAQVGQWTKVQLISGEEGYIFSELLRSPTCF